MNKITVKIDGMMCGMCEAHICDAIRRAFPDAKKVKASRKRGEATFLKDNRISDDILKKVVDESGYHFVSVSSEEYKRHVLLLPLI